MGPSGCGKTVLLDVLASRHPSDNISGTIKVNAEFRNQRYMKRAAAYILQNDVLFEKFTVRETLMYTVDFRLEGFITKNEKMRRVIKCFTNGRRSHERFRFTSCCRYKSWWK
jgi:ABC-type multidrug transport system ATPase subunit